MVLALRQKNQDAIAISAYLGTDDHRRMLFEWATDIVVMQEKFAAVVPLDLAHKIRIVDVGEDVWSNPTDPELLGHLRPLVADWERRHWDLTAPARPRRCVACGGQLTEPQDLRDGICDECGRVPAGV